MNRKGRNSVNVEVMDRLTKSVNKEENGYLSFNDEVDRKIVVDYKSGKVGVEIDDNIKWYNTGDRSTKANGYVYATVFGYVDYYSNESGVYNDLSQRTIGQHTIVAMTALREQYDRLVERYGKENVVVNHKDNCPLHNNVENLEWVRQKDNSKHRDVVRAIFEYAPENHTIYVNAGDNVFESLIQGVSFYDIEEYASECGIKVEELVIDEDFVSNFIGYLYFVGAWGTMEG